MAKIAVILVHYNDTRWLINWMEKMKNQNPDEVIVVDDGSNEVQFELIKQMVPDGVQLVKNDFGKGPFSAFAKGCSVAESEFVSCWSADDEPMPQYLLEVRYALNRFPFTSLLSVNANVVREGKVYKRTLLPFDSYISPAYAVKLFQAGLAKNINLIGNVIRKQIIYDTWNNGGSKLKANFDGMYFFFAVFQYGFINLGKHLVLYRSYSNGLGASSNRDDLTAAHEIHKRYFRNTSVYAYNAAKASGIWDRKTQWKAWIAQWAVRYLPKFAKEKFYNWFYSYDWRIEKL